MADGRVKAKSGAYDEAAGLSVIADASDVHRPDRRGQDLFQRFFWIRGESQASGQIVAGAKRDIAKFCLRQMADPVQHFIYRAVASKDDQPEAVLIPARFLFQVRTWRPD